MEQLWQRSDLRLVASESQENGRAAESDVLSFTLIMNTPITAHPSIIPGFTSDHQLRASACPRAD
jgi:hypothetical protein